MIPLDINDYEKIEDRFKMQVNVFGYENKVYPLCISKKSFDQTLNLSRLMFSITKPKDKKHYCMSCLQNFTAEEILSNHKCLY